MSGGASAPAKVPVRRRRRWAFVLTALVLGLVVALVLVELAFRMFWSMPPWLAEFQQAGMYEAAADTGTPVLQPGYRGSLQIGADGPTTTVAINALGMRGPEIGAKQAGEKRVLVVGDSLVFGYGVEAEQALPAVLQRALGERVTAGNGGVPGFGSRDYAAHLARLDRAFGSDVFVACGFLGNDAIDDTAPLRTVYAGLKLDGVMARLVQTSWRTRLALRSRAALWFENWVFTNKPEWSPLATAPPDPAEMQQQAGMPPRVPVDQCTCGLFLDAIDEQRTWQPGAPPPIPRLSGYLRDSLQRILKTANGRPVVFVVLPTTRQVDERLWREQLQAAGMSPEEYRRGLGAERWLAVARELGMPALDATPILEASGLPTTELYVDMGHLSVRGNQLVGEWLAGEVAPLLK